MSPFARGERLAVVERLELGELVAVGLDQLRERVHEPGALRRRDLAQRALERRAGGGDGAVDVLGPGLGDLADRLAGGRVDGLEGAPVGGLGPLAADQQAVRRPVDELARGVGEGCAAVAVAIARSYPPGERRAGELATGPAVSAGQQPGSGGGASACAASAAWYSASCCS